MQGGLVAKLPLLGLRRSWSWRIGLALTLLLSASSCRPRVPKSEELTILLMPMERAETARGKPFSRADCDSLFPHLKFDNKDADWSELKIGYHRWLCGQLENFAQNEKIVGPIHVRFTPWDEALNYIEAFKDDYDVVQVPSTWTAYLISEGILAKYRDVNEDAYVPGSLKSCRVQGKQEIFAVPWHVDTRVLYYRQELAPDSNELLTFFDFSRCLEERKQQQEVSPKSIWQAPFGMGVGREWDILHNTFTYFFSGKILEKRWWQWHPVFHLGEQREGLRKFWWLAQQGLIHFVTVQHKDEKRVSYVLAKGLVEGRYDAVLGGPHMRVAFKDSAGIKAVPVPQLVDDQAYSFLGGSHIAVSTAARRRGNQREARALINFLTSRESQVGLYENTDALPARLDAIEHFIAENPRWQAFEVALKHAEPYPSIVCWAKDVEREVVLNHFYSILLSVQKGEQWDVVTNQLKAAAAELELPFPWGIMIAVISIVGVIIVVLALAVIIVRRRKKTATLKALTLRMDVVEYHPLSIKLLVSGPPIPKKAESIIGEPTSALLLEGMHYGFVSWPFVIYVRGKIVNMGNARRTIGIGVKTDIANAITTAIENAATKRDRPEISGLSGLTIFSGVRKGSHKGEHEFVLPKYVGALQSKVLDAKALVEPFSMEIRDSREGRREISNQRLIEMRDTSIKAINADCTSVAAWYSLLFAIKKLQIDLDEVRPKLPTDLIQGILPHILLRYLRAINICYGQGRLKLEPAAETFAMRAKTLFEVLEEFGLLPETVAIVNWHLAYQELENDLTPECKWLARLIEIANLENSLCLAAISNSRFWKTPESEKDQQGKDAADAVRLAFNETSWFKDAKTFLENKYQCFAGKADELLWYMWMGLREYGLKMGEFPEGEQTYHFAKKVISYAEKVIVAPSVADNDSDEY